MQRNSGARRHGSLNRASQVEDEPRGHQNAAGYEDAKEDAAENHCEITVFRRATPFGVERCVHWLDPSKPRRDTRDQLITPCRRTLLCALPHIETKNGGAVSRRRRVRGHQISNGDFARTRRVSRQIRHHAPVSGMVRCDRGRPISSAHHALTSPARAPCGNACAQTPILDRLGAHQFPGYWLW